MSTTTQSLTRSVTTLAGGPAPGVRDFLSRQSILGLTIHFAATCYHSLSGMGAQEKEEEDAR